MRVTLSRDAIRDRRRIESYYAGESPAAAAGFRRRLRDALRFLADYPSGAPVFTDEIRVKRILGFPTSILYVVEARVYVLAIIDERRDHDVL